MLRFLRFAFWGLRFGLAFRVAFGLHFEGMPRADSAFSFAFSGKLRFGLRFELRFGRSPRRNLRFGGPLSQICVLVLRFGFAFWAAKV